MKRVFAWGVMGYIGFSVTAWAAEGAPAQNSTEARETTTIEQRLESAAEYGSSGNRENALVLFESVLAEDAENVAALIGSGALLFERFDYAEAFERYDQAVQLDPSLSQAWSQHGIAAFALQDFDTAIQSMERAVANRPVNGFFFESLAWAYFSNRDWERAIESARTAVLMYQREKEFSLYPFFILHFSQLKTGNASQARSTLRYAERNLNGQNWPFPVLAFLKERIDHNRLLASVTSPAEETEAHLYIGMSLLFANQPEQALPHLNWAGNKGSPAVFEHTVAQTFKTDALVTQLPAQSSH